jgi:hypothetical protein
MGKAIASQHPAVVLRSHYNQLRALLAVAMIAVVGLAAAVVILATDDDPVTIAGSATQANAPSPAETTRFDGGPEEGSRGVVPALRPGVRFDGGPEEGTTALTRPSAPATFDANSIKEAPGVRHDGGPDEGTRSPLTAPQAPATRYDGGPEEGTRSPLTSPLSPGTRTDGGPEEGSRGAGH